MALFRRLFSAVRYQPDSTPRPPSNERIKILTPSIDPPDECEVAGTTPDEYFNAAPTPAKSTTRAAPRSSYSEKFGERIGGDLWGIQTTIEYIDSKGQSSVRRIRIIDLRQKDNGCAYVNAHCFERKAQRNFRIDRILHVIDDDGVVYDPVDFFEHELMVEFEHDPLDASVAPPAESAAPKRPTPAKKPSAPAKPGVKQRSAARDGLRLLVALGRSDDILHPAETLEIVSYITREAQIAGVSSDDDDIQSLFGYVRRQRPDTATLEKCVEGLEREGVDAKLRFLDAARRVISADGIKHPNELKLLSELQSSLEAEVG